MVYDYTVKFGGKYYPAHTEVPEKANKKSNNKEQKEDSKDNKGLA